MTAAENVDVRSYPAVPSAVPLARRAVAEFAEAAGVAGEELENVRLAVSEAITNVVVHAYRGGKGMIHVSAAVASGELWVLVGDDGAGLHAREDSPGLGVGLALIADISEDFAVVNRSSGGTELRMRFLIRGAARRDPTDYNRGSSASASRPASSVFSTTR
jgi:serine/threonine-protein kinase RsbW